MIGSTLFNRTIFHTMQKNLLHYQYQPASLNPNANTMVFLHGLFGDLNNLGVIARGFSDDYNILRVDLRNHGQSFHSDEMNYLAMAEDLRDLFQHLSLDQMILVGHSMGGKTAMTLAQLAPELIEKLIVIDIAPVKNPTHRHNHIFAGLFAVQQAQPTTRQQAKNVIAEHIPVEGEQQFMLKSFDPTQAGRFRFNLASLHQNYLNIMDWQPVYFEKPTLFIKGGLSDYIQAEDSEIILAQFPQAKFFVVANADHWVHAEKPEAVIRAIQRFLAC